MLTIPLGWSLSLPLILKHASPERETKSKLHRLTKANYACASQFPDQHSRSDLFRFDGQLFRGQNMFTNWVNLVQRPSALTLKLGSAGLRPKPNRQNRVPRCPPHAYAAPAGLHEIKHDGFQADGAARWCRCPTLYPQRPRPHRPVSAPGRSNQRLSLVVDYGLALAVAVPLKMVLRPIIVPSSLIVAALRLRRI